MTSKYMSDSSSDDDTPAPAAAPAPAAQATPAVSDSHDTTKYFAAEQNAETKYYDAAVERLKPLQDELSAWVRSEQQAHDFYTRLLNVNLELSDVQEAIGNVCNQLTSVSRFLAIGRGSAHYGKQVPKDLRKRYRNFTKKVKRLGMHAEPLTFDSDRCRILLSQSRDERNTADATAFDKHVKQQQREWQERKKRMEAVEESWDTIVDIARDHFRRTQTHHEHRKIDIEDKIRRIMLVSQL